MRGISPQPEGCGAASRPGYRMFNLCRPQGGTTYPLRPRMLSPSGFSAKPILSRPCAGPRRYGLCLFREKPLSKCAAAAAPSRPGSRFRHRPPFPACCRRGRAEAAPDRSRAAGQAAPNHIPSHRREPPPADAHQDIRRRPDGAGSFPPAEKERPGPAAALPPPAHAAGVRWAPPPPPARATARESPPQAAGCRPLSGFWPQPAAVFGSKAAPAAGSSAKKAAPLFFPLPAAHPPSGRPAGRPRAGEGC